MRFAVLIATIALGMPTPDAPPPLPPSRAAHVVAILPMEGEMDAISTESLTRRARMAREAGADAVVIAFDTPGGEMMSTLELCRRIKGEFPPNTVAWIRPRAYSAGTIAALACREIVVTPDAVFGDAAPIAVLPVVGLQSLPPAERAKLAAPLLSEVTDSARRRGHDERLCRAFVDPSEELWLLEDQARGERFIVDASEYEAVFGGTPDERASEAIPRTPGNVLPWITDALRRPGARLDAAPQDLPPGRAPLTSSDRERLQVVSRLDRADELLTLRADEARALGMAAGTVADEVQLRAFLGAERSFTLGPRWSEGLARLLTSWWVRALLVIALLACFAGEMTAPGLGWFSIAGLGAASLLFAGPLLAGLADWWPGVLLLAGMALVAVELLVFPGSIFLGAIGGVAIVAGTVGLFVVSDPSPDPTQGVIRGLGTLVAAMTAAAGTAWWMGRSDGGLLGRAVLRAEIGGPPVDSVLPPIGALGVAQTDLRPVGTVQVGGRTLPARSDGWIGRGMSVRVIGCDGIEIRVEAAP